MGLCRLHIGQTSFRARNMLPTWCMVVGLVLICFSVVHGQQENQVNNESDQMSLEEKRIVTILRDKLSDLEKREEQVQSREEELKVLRSEVENKLEKMRNLRQALEETLGKQQEVKEAKVKELSGIYENMNAGRAAQAMLSMDRDLAIGILSNMRRKLAGEVLDQMPGEDAAEISRDYSNMGGGEPPP